MMLYCPCFNEISRTLSRANSLMNHNQTAGHMLLTEGKLLSAGFNDSSEPGRPLTPGLFAVHAG